MPIHILTGQTDQSDPIFKVLEKSFFYDLEMLLILNENKYKKKKKKNLESIWL